MGTIKQAVADMHCIVCERAGVLSQAELHHPLKPGGRKVHPDCVIPLCPTHHRSGLNNPHVVSRHPWHREFERRYGTEDDLWAEVRARLLLRGLRPPPA